MEKTIDVVKAPLAGQGQAYFLKSSVGPVVAVFPAFVSQGSQTIKIGHCTVFITGAAFEVAMNQEDFIELYTGNKKEQ